MDQLTQGGASPGGLGAGGGGNSSGGVGGDPGNSGGDPGCFVAGTPVTMADGTTKPIEKVQIGDRVASFDGLGALVPQRVVDVLKHPNKKVIKINDIIVTPEHRFLLANGEYFAIGEIVTGTALIAADTSTITGWTRDEVSETHDTYNLTIENTHTYIAAGFRVHNWK